jgi:hypothetical protein
VNAYLLAEFFTTDSHVQTVQTVRGQSLDSARSLASMILSTHRHLVNSVPYLEWLLRQTSGAETGYRVQSPDFSKEGFQKNCFRGPSVRCGPRNHEITAFIHLWPEGKWQKQTAVPSRKGVSISRLQP